MSWSVNFEGNQDDVKTVFDGVREQSKGNGMIDAELSDIDAVRDLVADFARRAGLVKGNANGHWINAYVGSPTPPQLGQVSVTISLASEQI